MAVMLKQLLVSLLYMLPCFFLVFSWFPDHSLILAACRCVFGQRSLVELLMSIHVHVLQWIV